MRPLRTEFLERAIAAMVSALLIAGCSSAVQPSAPPSPGAAPTTAQATAPLDLCRLPDLAPAELRSKPGYVQFAVSIADANGAPITGLRESDFIVRSGAKSYPISYFREVSNAVTPAVEYRLAWLHAYGRTALYDTIEQSLKTLSTAKYRDRALVLVTDGIDNSTTATRKSLLLASLAQNHVPIYAIGIGEDVRTWRSTNMEPNPLAGSRPADEVDKSALDAIASASGGEAFVVPPMDKDRGQAFAAALATLSGHQNASE